MLVRCWGARGSIPVSGREYLKYGGSTTCMEVETDDGQVIILDAGSGIRKLGNTLLKEGRYDLHLVFTHAHWDHILGFPFFRPIYVDGVRLQVYGCPFAQESLRGFLSDAMRPPHFPVDLSMVRAQITYHGICQAPFTIGPVSIAPILLSHPNQGMGYRLEADGKRFVFLTDNELRYQHPGGLTFEDYVAAATGADLLIHDAEFTEKEYTLTRTWGHSRYTDALDLAFAAGAARLGLFHHNQERSDDALDGIVADCQRIIGEKQSGLDCFAVHEGMEQEL
jgi:phosphoribosyl 1,2-cyclic phosphodiesterase